MLTWIKGAALALMLASFGSISPAVAQSPAIAPVAGKPNLMLSAYDLGKLGFEVEEFFLTGTAQSFRLPGAPTADGNWSVLTAKYSAILETCLSDGSTIFSLRIRESVDWGTPVRRCSSVGDRPWRSSKVLSSAGIRGSGPSTRAVSVTALVSASSHWRGSCAGSSPSNWKPLSVTRHCTGTPLTCERAR